MRNILNLVLLTLLYKLFYVNCDSESCSKDGKSCMGGGNFIVGSYKDLLQDIGKFFCWQFYIIW